MNAPTNTRKTSPSNYVPDARPLLRGVIHQSAALVALVAGSVLVTYSWLTHRWYETLSVGIYAVAMVNLFAISATYHRGPWRSERSLPRWQRADHATIFVFIAATYTPFSVLTLPTVPGIVILSIAWIGAFAGVALAIAKPDAPRWITVPIYLVLGWLIVFVTPSLVHNAGFAPLILLITGGLFYTVGAVFYAAKWPNPWPHAFGFHEIFHLFTVLAAGCHYAALWVVLAR